MGVEGWEVDPNDEWRDIPVGLCDRMASIYEICERERTGRLHCFEMKEGILPPKADYDRVVKEFIRSCVGHDFQRPEVLRPFPVLRHTMKHLLRYISTLPDDWLKISDFVYNRLTSVRQDMVVQRIQGERAIEILEGCCRFLVYSSYRLTNAYMNFTDVKKPRKVPRKEYAAEGAKELTVINEIRMTNQCLGECLSSLIHQYNENEPESPNRAIFESLHLIRNTNLKSPNINKVPEQIRQNDLYRSTYHMTIEHTIGNHYTALTQVQKLSSEPILFLAYAPLLAQYQIIMFDHLRKACRETRCTPESIAKILCPVWLDAEEHIKVLFAINMAREYDIYNEKTNMIDFEKKLSVCKRLQEVSETAHILHFSRNWPPFREILHEIDLAEFLFPLS